MKFNSSPLTWMQRSCSFVFLFIRQLTLHFLLTFSCRCLSCTKPAFIAQGHTHNKLVTESYASLLRGGISNTRTCQSKTAHCRHFEIPCKDRKQYRSFGVAGKLFSEKKKTQTSISHILFRLRTVSDRCRHSAVRLVSPVLSRCRYVTECSDLM